MSRVWCDQVHAAAQGAVAATFGNLGTIDVKPGADNIIGFIVNAAQSLPTSGENGAPIVRVDSKSLGISQQDFVVGPVITDGIGTNDKEAPFYSSLVLANFGEEIPKDQFANGKVDFSITSSTGITGGWDACIGLIMSDFVPDMNYRMELLAAHMGIVSGGKDAGADAGIQAAALTSFATGIEVEGAKELRGLLGYVNPNAPTAGEAVSGFTAYTSSTIPDFAPQNWPFNVGYLASLGTPVGTPVGITPEYWPTRFPLPPKNFTIEVAQDLVIALSNAGDGVAAAGWQ